MTLPDDTRILPRLGDADANSVAPAGSAPEVGAFLDDAVEALAGLRGAAVADARLFGFVEAADFAGRVEEISRVLEYVQVIAAQAVERTRNQARLQVQGSAAPEWRTGRTEPAANGGATGAGAGTGADSAGASAGSVLDDGYRNAAEFLRARLRIGIGEARRRLSLAADALPGTAMTGQQVPARREHLAQALATAHIPSRSATIIATALDKIQHLTDQDTITRMEHALTRTATQSDPDFLTTMTRRWTDRIDQDGPEPSEEALRHTQGAFLRRRHRYGLHHLEIFATAEQYETLTTAMNTATNPRLTTTGADTTKPDTNTRTSTGTSTGTADPDTAPEANHGPVLDRRSRAQKLLDGLVGACAV
ncbi:13E12 repeat family protein, partial [Paenarthrobacter nicotinovorans]|uniref:13E12 repeat family protein n=1 Tax=Paenarthrobacter nicotinovorans TaxID=29320 RepID=UPI0021B2EC28